MSSKGQKQGIGYQSNSWKGQDGNNIKTVSSSLSSNTVRAKLMSTNTSKHSKQPTSKLNKMKQRMDLLMKKTDDSSQSVNWERKEMNNISTKMKSDEISCLDMSSSSSLSQLNEHHDIIEAINSETNESIYDDLNSNKSEIMNSNNKKQKLIKEEDNERANRNKELLHYDAIFSSCPIEEITKEHEKNNNIIMQPSQSSKNISFETTLNMSSSSDNTSEDIDIPLYKILKVGQVIEARYSGDGKWYDAIITQVCHAGYSNAVYTIHFQYNHNMDMDVSESCSWKDIKLLNQSFDNNNNNNNNNNTDYKIESKVYDTTPTLDSTIKSSHKVVIKDRSSIEVSELNPLAIQQASIKKGGWRAKAKAKKTI